MKRVRVGTWTAAAVITAGLLVAPLAAQPGPGPQQPGPGPQQPGPGPKPQQPPVQPPVQPLPPKSGRPDSDGAATPTKALEGMLGGFKSRDAKTVNQFAATPIHETIGAALLAGLAVSDYKVHSSKESGNSATATYTCTVKLDLAKGVAAALAMAESQGALTAEQRKQIEAAATKAMQEMHTNLSKATVCATLKKENDKWYVEKLWLEEK